MRNLLNFPKEIKTSRLLLKTVEPTLHNAGVFLDAINANREYLEAWQGHFESLHTVEEIIHKLNQRKLQTEKNEGVLFGIYKDNALVGRIRFFHIQDNACEIGYWLIQSVNGQGILSEALSALEAELFKFGFKKVILDIDAGNIKSERVAQRNGYVLEKRLPMESWAKCVGKCDSLIYTKTR